MALRLAIPIEIIIAATVKAEEFEEIVTAATCTALGSLEVVDCHNERVREDHLGCIIRSELPLRLPCEVILIDI